MIGILRSHWRDLSRLASAITTALSREQTLNGSRRLLESGPSKRPTQPRTELTRRSRPRLRPVSHFDVWLRVQYCRMKSDRPSPASTGGAMHDARLFQIVVRNPATLPILRMVISQGDVCWAERPPPAGPGPGFRHPVIVARVDEDSVRPAKSVTATATRA